MQSFDTNGLQARDLETVTRKITVCRVDELPSGSCRAVDLSDNRELALYNVNGEFYATDNFCPHKGAPLAAGRLCHHLIECDWHGWEFDVRTGECLTMPETVYIYKVVVEEGLVKVVI